MKQEQKAEREKLLKQLKVLFATLTAEERKDFITRLAEDYCELCWTDHVPCYCAPQYDE